MGRFCGVADPPAGVWRSAPRWTGQTWSPMADLCRTRAFLSRRRARGWPTRPGRTASGWGTRNGRVEG